jgi:type-F conjugative transfer system pilin assembly thiol-disulfide isomerase TrbB/type-F conjugative transfer system pilin chaperone TraQ
MRNIRFPDLDITGMWVLAVGVFFHLIARLVRKQPELAVQAGEIFGLGMVVFGGYRILNALIAEAEKEEKACEKQPEEHAKTPLAGGSFPCTGRMAQAGTLDEVKSLWDPRGISGTETASPQSDTPQAVSGASQPRWLRLSNGKQVDLRDWKVVLFMQGHCPYCHKFDPVLKQLAGQYGFSVFSYTIDGQGDDAFPEALPAPPDVMQTFFPNIPVATPTTFLVNVNTLAAYPILQGATDAQGFMARVDTVFQMMH